MKSISDVTGIVYENEDVVFFCNFYQSSFYIANNATIVDIFADSKGMLVFVFYREEHDKLLKLWLASKRGNKEE